MAEYPVALAREHRLADGRTVLIRPVRPDDAERESAFLARLSERARRMRFPYRGAPDPGLVMVGEARYVAHADGRGCELGIVVADGWHHSGLAQRLMEALIDAARTRGFETMEGTVLRENADMLEFSRALGFRVDDAPEDAAAVRIIRDLAGPQDGASSSGDSRASAR